MAEFNEQLRLISGLREQCRQCDEALYRARLDLQRTDQHLRRAEEKQTVVNPDRDREAAALRAQMAQLDARLAALREESEQVVQWFASLAEQQPVDGASSAESDGDPKSWCGIAPAAR